MSTFFKLSHILVSVREKRAKDRKDGRKKAGIWSGFGCVVVAFFFSHAVDDHECGSITMLLSEQRTRISSSADNERGNACGAIVH